MIDNRLVAHMTALVSLGIHGVSACVGEELVPLGRYFFDLMLKAAYLQPIIVPACFDRGQNRSCDGQRPSFEIVVGVLKTVVRDRRKILLHVFRIALTKPSSSALMGSPGAMVATPRRPEGALATDCNLMVRLLTPSKGRIIASVVLRLRPGLPLR
jgi:hypothetical protein